MVLVSGHMMVPIIDNQITAYMDKTWVCQIWLKLVYTTIEIYNISILLVWTFNEAW